MARQYTFNDPRDMAHEYGFESFDFGYQIALWVRLRDGDIRCVRMSRADAERLGCALASSVEE